MTGILDSIMMVYSLVLFFFGTWLDDTVGGEFAVERKVFGGSPGEEQQLAVHAHSYERGHS